MKDKLTPKVVAALGFVAIAAVALVGWFGLVSPQRSKAASLDQQIADARTQLLVAKASARHKPGAKSEPVSSALVMARAMPQRVAMPAVLRQLLNAARKANVRLDSVTPQAPTVQSGYSAVPMQVIVTGRYLPIQKFLRQLRTQAGVVGSRVHASGRLFDVDSVSLAAGEDGLPKLAATIQMNVFTYDGSAASTAPAAPAASAAPSTSSSATAAGRTP